MSADPCFRRPGARPLASLGLDATEVGALAVLRHFMTSFAQPESQAWTHAFDIACERWGIAEGPRLAQGLLAVLRAVMACRQTGLTFSNPLCQECRLRVTADEAAMMTMLHHMRRDATVDARLALADLTFGRMDARLIQAALALAARFPAERDGFGGQPDVAEWAEGTPQRLH
ncbi:hypothetical protein [Gemmobacter denitrificans]|uniref:Uncharacterized protein n=1 Tax=Gemmobacter denitrificans TaxID=3123040 RepID=A0ABU8BWN7_9RHOB